MSNNLSILITCPECDRDHTVAFDFEAPEKGDRYYPGCPADAVDYVEEIKCKCGEFIEVGRYKEDMIDAGFKQMQEKQDYYVAMKEDQYRENRLNARARRKAI